MTPVVRFGAIYALFFGGIGSFYTYLALYLKQLDLSGSEIGILLAAMPLGGFLSQPLWGVLSDLYQVRRRVLAISNLAVGLTALSLVWLDGFVPLLVAMVLLAVFRAPSSPLADALALEYLERQGRRQAYGQLRLWGSIGFAVTSLATGALVLGADLVWLVYLYAASVFALALVSLTLPEGRAERRPTLAAGRDVLREHPRLFVFLFGMALVGMTLGIVNSYQIVYLDDIHAPGWVSGLVFAATGIVEAGLMQLGGPLIRRWGLRSVFLAGVALMVPRWVLYVFIDDPLWVVPTQLLHSIGMLSLLVAGVLLVDQQLGGRWRATSQTLYQAALQGVGSAFGLVLAGVLYEWSGIDMVWWACAVAGSLGLLVLIWATRGAPMRTIETRGS